MRRLAESTARVALLLCVAMAAGGADWAVPNTAGQRVPDQRRVPEQREPTQRASVQRRPEYPLFAERILAQRVADEGAADERARYDRAHDERVQPPSSEGRAMRDAAITGAAPDDADPRRSANLAREESLPTSATPGPLPRDADRKPVRATGPTGLMPLRLSDGATRSEGSAYLDQGDAPYRIETAGTESNTLDTGPPSDDGIPLAPPSGSRNTAPGTATPVTPTKALTTVLASLGVVLGLFLLVVWFTRRALPKAVGGLPSEVVEVIGRAPLANRQQMSLVRIGHKLVLLSVTQHGAESLTEITDPDEVNRLCGICRAGQPGSISATFRQVLGQMSSQSRWDGANEGRGGEPSDASERGAGQSLIRQAQRR